MIRVAIRMTFAAWLVFSEAAIDQTKMYLNYLYTTVFH